MYLPASENSCSEGIQTSYGSEIQYGKGMILVVDDDERIIDLEKKMLGTLGYDVMVARSGKEALDLYNTHKHEIDLVVLDLVMPGLSGGETFNRLKEIDEDVNVLLSTGYRLNEKIEGMLDRGCGGYIQKPFSFIDFSIKIKQMMNTEA